MFEAEVPARKFKNYVCTQVEAYAAEAGGEDALKRNEKAGAVKIESKETDNV